MKRARGSRLGEDRDVVPGPIKDESRSILSSRSTTTSGKELDNLVIGPFRGTSDWHEETKTFNIPAEAREGIFRIGLFGATGSACVRQGADQEGEVAFPRSGLVPRLRLRLGTCFPEALPPSSAGEAEPRRSGFPGGPWEPGTCHRPCFHAMTSRTAASSGDCETSLVISCSRDRSGTRRRMSSKSCVVGVGVALELDRRFRAGQRDHSLRQVAGSLTG